MTPANATTTGSPEAAGTGEQEMAATFRSYNGNEANVKTGQGGGVEPPTTGGG